VSADLYRLEWPEWSTGKPLDISRLEEIYGRRDVNCTEIMPSERGRMGPRCELEAGHPDPWHKVGSRRWRERSPEELSKARTGTDMPIRRWELLDRPCLWLSRKLGRRPVLGRIQTHGSGLVRQGGYWEFKDEEAKR
jgi:hypothetical protein